MAGQPSAPRGDRCAPSPPRWASARRAPSVILAGCAWRHSDGGRRLLGWAVDHTDAFAPSIGFPAMPRLPAAPRWSRGSCGTGWHPPGPARATLRRAAPGKTGSANLSAECCGMDFCSASSSSRCVRQRFWWSAGACTSMGCGPTARSATGRRRSRPWCRAPRWTAGRRSPRREVILQLDQEIRAGQERSRPSPSGVRRPWRE